MGRRPQQRYKRLMNWTQQQCTKMPNFSFSMANNFLRFTPESLDEIRKRIATKKAKSVKALEEGNVGQQEEEESIRPQLDLKVFKKLPLIYGKIPPWLTAEALEDVDPYYRDHETFMVLSARNRIFRFTATKALFLFSPFHPLRRLAIKILIHSLFIAFITGVVLLNCVFMTLSEYPVDPNATEIAFTSVYTAEFVIKVVARGFILNEFTYLRDPWNFLDFIVLTVTYIAHFGEFARISALRIFRVLRTLKAVSVIPGLKVIIASLLQSVKKLANVMLLTVFSLAVFALVGLQLFMGNLKNKCVLKDYLHVNISNRGQQCDDGSPVLCGFSGNETAECGANYTCQKRGDNPDFGYTSFDHFGWAFLSLFRLMTQDSWERLYHQVIRTSGKTYVMFFMIIIFLCSFYLFNLILAVVTMAYEEQNKVTLEYTKLPPTHSQPLPSLLACLLTQETYYMNCFGNEWEEPEFQFPPGLKQAVKKYLIWECCPLWLQIKERMKKIMTNPFMELFIQLCIIVNTLLMALEQNPIAVEVVSVGNRVFTCIFSAEVVFKMIALDPYYYFQNAWNIFDFCVVAIVNITMMHGIHISVLRMLRIFKLSKFWPALNKLMKIMMKSVGPLGNLTLVLIFTIFIFAVVGKQAFSRQYNKVNSSCSICITDDVPSCDNSTGVCRMRWHMKDFLHSFLIIFRILCGEWIDTMMGCMQVAGEGGCIILFMLVLVLGNLVVLNLFIALLLSSFSSSELESEADGKERQAVIAQIRRWLQCVKRWLWDWCCNTLLRKLKTARTKNEKRLDHDTSASEASTVDQRSPAFHLSEIKKVPKDCFPRVLVQLFPCCRVNTDKFPGNIWWRYRKTCYKIIKHSWFESFIIFMIVLSSGALIFEDIHLNARPKIKALLEYADILFFYIFFLEMLLKWVAYGLTKYFTNGWCWLDFIIVCVSYLCNLLPLKENNPCDTSTKSLRTLRALRPLRALSRFKGIKVVVNALTGAIPSIGNVLLVCVVLWLPFNILGVQLFRGKFWSCNSTISNKDGCIRIQRDVNFDNVAMGYLALLQVATFKGWMDIMYAAVDAPDDKDPPPCFEKNVYNYLYFVVFIVFGSFFMLNLFIGVVIDNFNQQRKKICGELIFLSDEQKKYYNALKKLGAKKPRKIIPRPRNKFQGFLYDIVNKQAFDIFIISLILLNVVIMAVEYEGQGDETRKLLKGFNYAFVGIFTGECIMKILALRLHFLKDNWNIFDFVVVILSIFSSAATELWESLNFPPTILRVIRVARVTRILRLIRGAKGLRTLLFALLMSLPALTNIGLLLFLIMFIYAIFGMTNFACATWEAGIDDIFNFQTFGSSMLCLFQITTSAGWDELLRPMLSHANKSCAKNLNLTASQLKGPCVNRSTAIAYFVSYIVISFLIVVNMYIAVIIENLNVATEESTEPLGDDDFDIFYEIWGKFDPLATQFISYSALSDFADSLAEPLRIPKPNKQQLIAMDLPMVNANKIHCLDILFAFTKRVLGESGEMGSLESEIEKRYPERIAYEPIVTTLKRKQDESAVIIQKAFRKHLLQRAMKAEACQDTTPSSPLDRISEEESASVFGLSETEDSQSHSSQSPSSVCIPPSYSNVTGTTDDIPQVKITDCPNDDIK
ncbi:sodium channel protein type 5 subunit alpha-like [Elgaria multicarinata webbii]|uniref:sodium channel protein type 5 subunit alpha-like n=1 Tax=Elgaria multicarinata webbii TaxID=159646 RepID=UPI002FCD0FA2